MQFAHGRQFSTHVTICPFPFSCDKMHCVQHHPRMCSGCDRMQSAQTMPCYFGSHTCPSKSAPTDMSLNPPLKIWLYSIFCICLISSSNDVEANWCKSKIAPFNLSNVLAHKGWKTGHSALQGSPYCQIPTHF